jgi:hypothetical protein
MKRMKSMKRRQAIQAILGTPVLTALPPPASAAPQQQSETPKLNTAMGDAVADPVRKSFTPPQFAALRMLGDLLAPASENRPGASQAKAPKFLDFLLSQSPHSRQVLYSNGLDRLQLESGRRYNRRFEDLTAEQADAVVGPLREKWTYRSPADSFRGFLRAAKDDLLTATLNSREFAEARTAAGRRAGGMGTYQRTLPHPRPSAPQALGR